jgi:hypothetical protein
VHGQRVKTGEKTALKHEVSTHFTDDTSAVVYVSLLRIPTCELRKVGRLSLLGKVRDLETLRQDAKYVSPRSTEQSSNPELLRLWVSLRRDVVLKIVGWRGQ